MFSRLTYAFDSASLSGWGGWFGSATSGGLSRGYGSGIGPGNFFSTDWQYSRSWRYSLISRLSSTRVLTMHFLNVKFFT